MRSVVTRVTGYCTVCNTITEPLYTVEFIQQQLSKHGESGRRNEMCEISFVRLQLHILGKWVRYSLVRDGSGGD